MTLADTDRLERVLGPGWQAMSFEQLTDRIRVLETAAGFARTLIRYMDDADFATAGETLGAVGVRDFSGSRRAVGAGVPTEHSPSPGVEHELETLEQEPRHTRE